MNTDTRYQLIRLSVDTELSEEFRLACRKELGDSPRLSHEPLTDERQERFLAIAKERGWHSK